MSVWVQSSRLSQEYNFHVDSLYSQQAPQLVPGAAIIPTARSRHSDPSTRIFKSSKAAIPSRFQEYLRSMSFEPGQTSTNSHLYQNAQRECWSKQPSNVGGFTQRYSGFERSTSPDIIQDAQWQQALYHEPIDTSQNFSNDLNKKCVHAHDSTRCSTYPNSFMVCGNTQDVFAQLGHLNDPAINGSHDPQQTYGTILSQSTMNPSLYSSPVEAQSPFDHHSIDAGQGNSSQVNVAMQSPDSCADDSAASLRDSHVADGPYNHLLYRCLLEAPNHELQLKDIYAWFTDNTERGGAPDAKGWQNSIRHNLSMNEGFYKGSRICGNNPKKNVWSLTDEAIRNGIQPTTRFRNNGRKVTIRRSTRHLDSSIRRRRLGAKLGQPNHRLTRNRQIPIDRRSTVDRFTSSLWPKITAATLTPFASTDIVRMQAIPRVQLDELAYTEEHNIPSPNFTAADFQPTTSSVADFLCDTYQRSSDVSIDPSFTLQSLDSAESMYLFPHDYGTVWKPSSTTLQNYSSNPGDYYYDDGRDNHIYRLNTPAMSDSVFYSSDDETNDPITPDNDIQNTGLYSMPSSSL